MLRMPTLRLSDGRTIELPEGEPVGSALEDGAIAVRVGGELRDLSVVPNDDAEVEAVDAQIVHQQAEILGQAIQGPGIIARHRRRLPKAAHIGPHDPVMPRQGRDPGVPGKAALGIAMQHQHRVGPMPWVGEIVDLVMHVEIRGRAECRHRRLS